MKPARIETNSQLSKDQAYSRALGAIVLWQDLTASYPSAKDDERRMFDLLNISPPEQINSQNSSFLY